MIDFKHSWFIIILHHQNINQQETSQQKILNRIREINLRYFVVILQYLLFCVFILFVFLETEIFAFYFVFVVFQNNLSRQMNCVWKFWMWQLTIMIQILFCFFLLFVLYQCQVWQYRSFNKHNTIKLHNKLNWFTLFNIWCWIFFYFQNKSFI